MTTIQFDALVDALVGQLENTSGGSDRYKERISAHLTPCIGQLAVTAADDVR